MRFFKLLTRLWCFYILHYFKRGVGGGGGAGGTQEKSGKRCVSPTGLSNPESAQKLFVSLPCLRQENVFL